MSSTELEREYERLSNFKEVRLKYKIAHIKKCAYLEYIQSLTCTISVARQCPSTWQKDFLYKFFSTQQFFGNQFSEDLDICIYCLAYLSIENSLISKIFSGSPGLRRSCKGNTGKFQILTFSLLSQLFQPSPCSQELAASATQGHSDQDTGMCHSFGVKSVTILATLLPET